MSSPNDSAPSGSAVSSSEEATLPGSILVRSTLRANDTVGNTDDDVDGATVAIPSFVDPPPTLPTGEVIDGKNTLQSFVTTPPDVPVTPRDVTASESIRRGRGVHPTLPNGQVIDGKNTLQSFHAIPERTSANAHAEEPSVAAAPTATVVAIAIPEEPPEEPDIVYAELEPLEPPPPPSPWYKGRSIWVLLTVVAILIAVGLGAYIGISVNNNSGSDSGSEDSTVRMEILTSYINNITLSDQVIVANGTSPESQALAWLITNDTTLFTRDIFVASRQEGALSNSTIGFTIRQRYALLTMWFQQTDALQWAQTDDWLTNPDECKWYGVYCGDVKDTSIELKAVTSVQINGTRSYVGNIPADIGLLSNLRHFEIKETSNFDSGTAYVVGILPESIGQWTALTYFDVSFNVLLAGPLPDSIGQWTALTYFDVSDNALNGTLPESIGQWTALTYFDVNNNALTGTLPDSIGQWTDLLILRANVLTSYINNITLTNQTIMANGTSPESQALAWLIHNDTTTLDTEAVISQEDQIARNAIGFHILQRYTLLVMWFQQTETTQWAVKTGWLDDASECAWEGITCETRSIDYYIDYNEGIYNQGNQNAITQISFKLVSSYTGTIPVEIGLLSTLEHFEIANTIEKSVENGRYLYGTLPESIGHWTALTYFDVSFNELTGTLPDSIGQWTALTYFNVFDNALNGTLPDSIGQWTALTYFDVSANDGLTGTLPDSIGQWTDLTHFDVSFNVLTGPLPDSIGQWTDLTYFDVSVNGLNGTLPDSIGQWTALTYFSVSFNVLTGPLPDNIGQWTDLTYFDVSFNALNGTLPDSIGQWTALTYFSVYINSFTGTIPVSIGNWSLIVSADFSGNQFVGTLPDAICQYIDPDLGEILQVDCTVNCTCCTEDCVSG